jgi:hypothetical protein
MTKEQVLTVCGTYHLLGEGQRHCASVTCRGTRDLELGGTGVIVCLLSRKM